MSAANESIPPPQGAEEVLPRRFGKYTLLRRMATGGMAEIYLALQRSVAGFEKLIVIKRILPSMNGDRGFIDMLLHEARVAATLSHPNIVQTIDVGQVEGTYFIALEHVHGEDLRSIVRQMKKKGVTEFPLEHAIAVILGMCAGLSYAHERRDLDGTPLNIVHRDVSPQNVLVGFAGDVKVVDFGVAKSGTQTTEETKGQLKGKVPYMSPEQARGEDVDCRSDIFALGVMLFELTTGRRLFKGSTEFETLKMIVERDYPRPSWVSHNYPPKLETIVMKALEKDVGKRYQSAREMQADLEAFVRDEKLPVSSIALAEFMKMLFEEKLAAQKEALMQGRQLADIIASEIVHGEKTETGIESGRFNTTGVTASGAIALGSTPPPSSGTKWAIIGIPLALAVGGVGVFLATRGKPAPANATTTQAVVTQDAPKKSKAKLVVDSTPTGAHIWLNGEMRAEVTPATFDDLPVGTIDVKVGHEGYATAVEKVTLNADEATTRAFTLKKGVVSYEVQSAPANATAQVDNKTVKLPKFEVTPGEPHTLALVAPGYQLKVVKLASGEPGDSKKIDGAMQKASDKDAKTTTATTSTAAPQSAGGTGKIIVIAGGGGWCNAAVDGRSLGPTPTGAIDVGAGSHSVTCVDSNGARQSQGASVKAGETTRVRFTVAN